jgi:hypothetical protein
MNHSLDVVALRSSSDVITALAEILIETVAGGGSVSFPISRTAARSPR